VSSSPPGPGWYPDPRKPTRDRYWDGFKWTDQTRKKQGGGVRAAYGRLPRWAQIAIPIFAILIVVGAIAGEGESNDSGGPSTKTNSAETAGESKDAGSTEQNESGDPAENASDSNTPIVGPNGSVEVDTLRWRLNDAQATESIGDQQYGLGSKANGVYVVVELSVTNNKSESVTLTPEVVSLVVGDKSYSADSNAETALIGSGAKTLFLEDLGPDVTLTGKAAFDVAPAVLHQRPQLQFNELGFGSTHGYITLPPLSG
jgi:Protein of unknown function (DUF2510)/Domain of unknown function (DUF4352)